MLYLALALCAAGIVALDQLTKFLTVTHIPLGADVPLLPGIAHLTYVQNTGAAFSMLDANSGFSTSLPLSFWHSQFWQLPKNGSPAEVPSFPWPPSAAVP